MREIGSFIDLELETGKEFYNENKFGKDNIIRLNTCRAAICHAVKCYGVSKVYLPIYMCDSVRDCLIKNNIEVKYYRINRKFEPTIENNEKDSAIVFSNYYGIMSKKHFSFVNKFNNVIIDNAQAFFFEPIENCINTYSCRKFVGVSDGAYVIGKNVNKYTYEQDYSSDTASFLLMRKEYGCEGKAYEARKQNEQRIDEANIKIMSELTKNILDSANYDKNIRIRKVNFNYAKHLFDSINLININELSDDDAVPMVYPLLINKDIINKLHENKIFQGHWWEYIVDEDDEDSFEKELSSFILPITIDQRYTHEDIDYQYNIIKKELD